MVNFAKYIDNLYPPSAKLGWYGHHLGQPL